MSKVMTTYPSLTQTLTVTVVRPLVLSFTPMLKQSIFFFPHMLTGYLTTRDFVRLTNRSPFPSLMSFEHFIAIWPVVLEPQREWSMMETVYKKKINQTHFNGNTVRERTALCIRDAKDNMYDIVERW